MKQSTPSYQISDADRQVLESIQGGLPLTSHPYAEVGRQIGLSEEAVIERIQALQQNGVIRRMGIIVHHRPLGYQANAMVVWNLSSDQIESFGHQVSALDFVTLCYQRTPKPPHWPYTLYTMIHGKDRESVLAHVKTLKSLAPTEDIDHQVLFSSRRFKQQGARYFTKKQSTARQPQSRLETTVTQ